VLRRRVGGLAWVGKVLLGTGGSCLGRGFCFGRGSLLCGSVIALLRVCGSAEGYAEMCRR